MVSFYSFHSAEGSGLWSLIRADASDCSLEMEEIWKAKRRSENSSYCFASLSLLLLASSGFDDGSRRIPGHIDILGAWCLDARASFRSKV
jgi:hypothetical protein